MTDSEKPKKSTHSTRKQRLALWLVPAGLIALAAVIITIKKLRPAVEPQQLGKMVADVEVQTLKTQKFEEVLVLPGKILADETGVVSSELAGSLETWHVAEGARVKKGQIVAELNKSTLKGKLGEMRAALKTAKINLGAAKESLNLSKLGVQLAQKSLTAAKSNLESAQAARELADKNFQRTKRLVEQDIASTADLDRDTAARQQTKSAADAAAEAVEIAKVDVERAKVAQAQAEASVRLGESRIWEIETGIDSIQISIGKADLRSPAKGILDKHLIDEGEVLAPGQAVARVYDLDHVRVLVHVADRYAPFLGEESMVMEAFLKKNMPGARRAIEAKLVIPGLPRLAGGREEGISLPAEIARVGQTTNAQSNTFEVELRLRNPATALKEGMLARAHIKIVEYPEALLIPVKSVRVTDFGPRCLVAVEKDNSYVVDVREIDPRSVNKNDLLVQGDLNPGDLLIIAGGTDVFEGDEVRILKRDGEYVELEKLQKPAQKLGKATDDNNKVLD